MLPGQLLGLGLALGGIFVTAAGVMGWRWVTRGARIRWLVTLVGKVGARVIYVLLGLVLAGAGIALMVEAWVLG